MASGARLRPPKIFSTFNYRPEVSTRRSCLPPRRATTASIWARAQAREQARRDGQGDLLPEHRGARRRSGQQAARFHERLLRLPRAGGWEPQDSRVDTSHVVSRPLYQIEHLTLSLLRGYLTREHAVGVARLMCQLHPHSSRRSPRGRWRVLHDQRAFLSSSSTPPPSQRYRPPADLLILRPSQTLVETPLPLRAGKELVRKCVCSAVLGSASFPFGSIFWQRRRAVSQSTSFLWKADTS